MSDLSWLPIAGSVLGALISSATTYVVFERFGVGRAARLREEELRRAQKTRALELLHSFVTEEHFVRARLVTQEYLAIEGAKYAAFAGMNFDQVHEKLTSSSAEDDKEAYRLIRILMGFFWVIDQAQKSGQVGPDETIFDELYAWYWVYIIRDRLKGLRSQSMIFQKFDWLLKEQVVAKMQEEHDKAEAEMKSRRLLTPAAATGL